MLQFPTNVYPQNVAFDANNQQSLTCVFNGDVLSSVWYKAYDYYSGSLVSTSHRRTLAYNGESGGISLNTGSFENGNDYVIQLMYTQTTADGTENVYDMPIVRGNILSASGTSIMIADKIQNIYEWNVSNNVCSPSTIDDVVYAGAIIRVGAETRFINSYNRSTGQLIVDSAFTGSIANKSYTILANYLVTPQYYFMCREKPTLTVTKRLSDTGVQIPPDIIVEGSYSQADGSMIKYYTISLYWIKTGIVSYQLIDTSEKIYSQQIKYRFVNSWVDQGNETITYRAVCDVVTQDGETVSSHVDFDITADNEIVVIDNLNLGLVNDYEPDYVPSQTALNWRKIHQAVHINPHWTENVTSDATVDVYRRDLENGKVIHLFAGYGGTYDWTVPNKGEFEYVVLARDRNTGVPWVASRQSAQIKTNFIGYSITELIPVMGSKQMFARGDCWEFIGEIDDTTTTQNLNRTVQAGHNKYIVTSSGESNYLTGTLTADIGHIKCPDGTYKDTIDMVNAWRDFISRSSIYFLKTQKGDTLIVNIEDTPTVTYEENSPNVPARISFNWAECENRDNLVLRDTGVVSLGV